MSRAPDAMRKLDAVGIEDVCEMILEGKSYAAISAFAGVSVGSLCAWLSVDAERSAHAKTARAAAAQMHEERAADLLETAANAFELAKARELGFHLRWRASKVNPRDYGDKLQVDNTHAVLNLSDEEIARRRASITARLSELAPGDPAAVPTIEGPQS